MVCFSFVNRQLTTIIDHGIVKRQSLAASSPPGSAQRYHRSAWRSQQQTRHCLPPRAQRGPREDMDTQRLQFFLAMGAPQPCQRRPDHGVRLRYGHILGFWNRLGSYQGSCGGAPRQPCQQETGRPGTAIRAPQPRAPVTELIPISQEPSRPLIFIGHSLGGVVIKQVSTATLQTNSQSFRAAHLSATSCTSRPSSWPRNPSTQRQTTRTSSITQPKASYSLAPPTSAVTQTGKDVSRCSR